MWISIITTISSNALLDINSIDSSINFLKDCKDIFSFDVNKIITDSLNFKKKFNKIEKKANLVNLNFYFYFF